MESIRTPDAVRPSARKAPVPLAEAGGRQAIDLGGRSSRLGSWGLSDAMRAG